MKTKLTARRAVLGSLSLTLVGAALAAGGALPSRKSAAQSETAASAATPISSQKKQEFLHTLSKQPLAFEEYRDRSGKPACFTARGNGYGLTLTKDRMLLSVAAPPSKPAVEGQEAQPREGVVEISFAGANSNPDMAAVDKLPSVSNYFLGNDPSQWRTDVPNYARVRYNELYPGIDLVCYGKQKEVEYDFVVAPGADPDAIQLEVAGADAVRVDEAGDLVLAVNGGEIRQPKPVVYQEADGAKTTIDGQYLVEPSEKDPKTHRVRFALAEFDRSRELVIDPSVYWGAWIGGGSGSNHADTGRSIAVDSEGFVYVAGYTKSTSFPQTDMDLDTPGIQTFRTSTYGGNGYDAFVAKFSPDGERNVYSTYIGGNGVEYGYAVAVDGSNNIYVGGVTNSTNFPVSLTQIVPSITTSKHPDNDGFITKINADGRSLGYSAYVGSGGNDAVHNITVNSDGNVFVTGRSNGTNNWPAGSIQASKAAGTDAFAGKLNLAGNNWEWWTWVGGGGEDNAFGIAIDGDENVYLAGQTTSSTASWIPRNPAVAANYQHGSVDAFVVKISTGGTAFEFGYFIGGSSGDYGNGVAVAENGDIYVVGETASGDMMAVQPQLGATKLDSTFGGNGDGFIVRFSGNSMTMATYAGGALGDVLYDCAIDSEGRLWAVGHTASVSAGGIPVTSNAPQITYQGGTTDGFICVLDATGTSFYMRGYLGGNGNDVAYGVATGIFQGEAAAYVCGEVTSATNFPFTDGAYQQSSPFGAHEAFAVLIANNTRPIAKAGNDKAIECTMENNPVTLDGSASFDPDGDAITYKWYLLNEPNPPICVGTSAVISTSVPFGVHTFRLKVTDSKGASSTDDVVVTVVDNTKPTFPTLEPIEEGTSNVPGCVRLDYSPPVPVATDACDPSVTVTGVRRDPSNNVKPLNGDYVKGTHTITWTAVDDAGNTTIVTQTVKIFDDDKPVFDPSLPTEVCATAVDADSKEVFIDYPDPGTQVTDNCGLYFVDGFVDNAFNPDEAITEDGYYTFPVGQTVITWIAADEALNFEAYVTIVLVEPKSEFSTDNDGWSIEGTGVIGPTWEGTGGSPGGYIHGDDTLAGTAFWYFVAPSKYYSTILNPYSTGITFDLWQNAGGAAVNSQEDVILVGNGITLTYDIAQPMPGTWTSYSIPLDTAAGWVNKATGMPATLAQLRAVLERLTAIKIRGNYNDNTATTGGLDNFRIKLK